MEIHSLSLHQLCPHERLRKQLRGSFSRLSRSRTVRVAPPSNTTHSHSASISPPSDAASWCCRMDRVRYVRLTLLIDHQLRVLRLCYVHAPSGPSPFELLLSSRIPEDTARRCLRTTSTRAPHCADFRPVPPTGTEYIYTCASCRTLGSRFYTKNMISEGASRSRTPIKLQYGPRVTIL